MRHRAAIAVAPTPTAAAWLARAGVEKNVSGARLEQVLAALPVALLEDDARTLEALENIGVRSLGELSALPRAGLARRFGRRLVDEMDKALGRQPDPRLWYEAPAKFSSGIELPVAVADTGQLLFAARRLILQLCGYLNGRAAGVQRFTLELRHEDKAPTLCIVGLVAPAADAARLTRLLKERLQRIALPGPVVGMTLAADQVQPLSRISLDLFADGAQATDRWGELVEQLRARLGEEAVRALALCADHRPERASVAVEPGSSAAASLQVGERPLWLLERPLALPEQQGAPRHRGALELIGGPERIESGWWDGGDVRRDYFLARDPAGALLWIYRERQLNGRWYLHGLFA